MSDTEEVIIKRIKPVKNTKPEIAREKLKEKRLRLKAEKEAEIVEKAKQKYGEEQIALKQKEAEEEEKKSKDPMTIMMKKIEDLQNQLLNKNKSDDTKQVIKSVESKPKRGRKVKEPEPEPEPEIVKPKVQRKKKVVEEPVVISKPARKPRQVKNVVESPSNIFVGDNTTPNIPDDDEYPYVQNPPKQINHLESVLMARRRALY
jgi:hypothetical protein